MVDIAKAPLCILSPSSFSGNDYWPDLVYIISLHVIYFYFNIIFIQTHSFVLKSYFRIKVHVSFCILYCFLDMSTCKSSSFNHPIVKPVSSIALCTCPVNKSYPSKSQFKSYPDFFFFSNRIRSFPLLSSTFILLVLVWWWLYVLVFEFIVYSHASSTLL